MELQELSLEGRRLRRRESERVRTSRPGGLSPTEKVSTAPQCIHFLRPMHPAQRTPRVRHQSFALVVGCVAMVPFLRALLLMKTRSRDWAVSSSPKRVFFSTGGVARFMPSAPAAAGFFNASCWKVCMHRRSLTRMPCRSLRIPKNSERTCIENFYSPCHPSRGCLW